jgi:hypothetical protein
LEHSRTEDEQKNCEIDLDQMSEHEKRLCQKMREKIVQNFWQDSWGNLTFFKRNVTGDEI